MKEEIKTIAFNINQIKSSDIIKSKSTTKRLKKRSIKNRKNSEDTIQKEDKKIKEEEKWKKLLLKKWIIIISLAIVLSAVIALIIEFLLKKKKVDRNAPTEDNNKDILTITREAAKKAFEPNFKVVSKVNKLNTYLMKSYENQISITNGFKSLFSSFYKAIFNIYTLNGTLASKEEKEFYSVKYTTVIIINSQCQSFSGKENNCMLVQYLDLNIKNRRNLGKKDEEDPEAIKDIILPICIIEHSDTNIILSVSCPETLSPNVKNDVVSAFNCIKPESFKGLIEDDSIAGTRIELGDDKIYINTFEKDCEDYNGNPEKTANCNSIRNITTDKEGNLISINKTSYSEIFQDEENKNIKSKEYYIEEISNKTENIDPLNFKYNLDIILGLIETFLKKEKYISMNDFNSIIEGLMAGDSNSNENLRMVEENESEQENGVKREDIFSKDIYGINLCYRLQNDIGQGYQENAKTISSLITGNSTKELSHDEANTNLNITLNEFITLIKAENMLATSLFEKLNDPLLNLRDKIDLQIKYLNDLLVFEHMSSIFDSTLSLENLENLPYTFMTSSNNLFEYLKKKNKDIVYSINEYKNTLKDEITSFLSESHNLLFYIFQNLTETTNLLSSSKSKIARICSYYLNDTDTSYSNIIQNVKEIIDSYFIKEKNLILPLINESLNKFTDDFLEPIKNELFTLDYITEKIENGSLSINLVNNTEIYKIIDNLKKSKKEVNDIMLNVVEQINKSVEIQDSGYFETQKFLNENNKSYYEICNNAIKISNDLDNNSLIDKVFDNNMIYFREQFIFLLKNMEISKMQKFPLKENVLSYSSFSQSKMNIIDDNLKTEKQKVMNFVINENKEYLKYINQIIDSFNKENNLDSIINNIQIYLSDSNLNKLKNIYDELLTYAINDINNIIENNKKLGIDYLQSIKDAGSTHCTKGFINKFNIYKDNINTIRNYIKHNLKSNLVNKYKNAIIDVRSQLQIIKSNIIIKKYYNSIIFVESHLKIIDSLFSRFDKYISDILFNKNYLPKINSYIQKTIESLNSIENEYNSYYSEISKLNIYNTEYDYYRQERNSYKCCKKRFIWCWKYGTCYNYYYQGYYSDKTNNHLNLNNINSEKYTNNFDSLFSDIYLPLRNNIRFYNATIYNLSDQLDKKTKEIISKKVDYLNTISEKINKIIINNLDNNLLNQTYNYFKNDLSNNLPIELNNILERWKNIHDKLDEYLNLNITNFKSKIEEFPTLCSFYYQMYKKNITYDYVDSLISQRKNDLNYTVKYYYNLILSKVNKTFSDILNNIPINEKPFDEILKKRENEIQTIYNDIIKKIEASKNKVLIHKNQLSILNNEENDFFSTESIKNNIINKIEKDIPLKCTKLLETSKKVNEFEKEELVIARFYLENAENAKQYKEIIKDLFIDLQNNVYQDMIDETYKFEPEELTKNLITSLMKFKEKIIQSFKYEKDKYYEIIQNKIYKEYFTKENLEKEINSMYSTGLTNLDNSSKIKIDEYIDEVINIIKEYISSEAYRLTNELSSYSINYKKFEQTLNDYKNSIYDKFYFTIFSVVNNFHKQITDTFYTNYIQKYLKDLIEITSKENFREHIFLNVSLNLNETMKELTESLINDYQNLSLAQIDNLNGKHIEQLNGLFSFPRIKKKINDEIDNIYKSKLLPALKVYAIYKSGDEGITDYDFSTTILNSINNLLNKKIQETQEIINKTKGINYTIVITKYPDFSLVKKNEFKEIKNSFNSYCNIHDIQELKEIKNVIFINIDNNFNRSINNFIPSFGKDFIDRIIKYNEIQKIKPLYEKIRYISIETLIYYIGLSNIHTTKYFPEDLKNKILNLNNLEIEIKSNHIRILSDLNSKLEKFFEDTKNYLIEKYISLIKINPIINEAFNDNIKLYIVQIIEGKRNILENNYKNMMNSYIKEPFIKEYSEVFNTETNNLISFIKENKVSAKNDLDSIFILNTHDVVLDIEKQLNSTINAIEKYKLHFNTFVLPEKIKSFLNGFSKSEVKPIYKQIKDILDAATKDLVIENLDKNTEKFMKTYSIENFESKINEINNNLTKEFNYINDSLNSYGIVYEDYSINLEKEMANYHRIRRLDDLDIDKINYNQKISNVKLNETLEQIAKGFVNLKKFVETLNLFNEFDTNINTYINDLGDQFYISQEKINNNEEYYDELNDRLQELNIASKMYYEKANLSYHQTKELIKTFLDEINELIEESINVTYKTMVEKINQIKNNFKSINIKNNIFVGEIPIEDYETVQKDKNYVIKTQIQNYLINNEINLELIFEDGDIKKPKLIGNIINKNKPEKYFINFYSKYGHNCGKFGRKININLNNISLSMNLSFNIETNNIIMNTTLNSDEYEIIYKFYEAREKEIKTKIIGGISFKLGSNVCDEEEIDIPEGELGNEIVEKKMKNYVHYYNY